MIERMCNVCGNRQAFNFLAKQLHNASLEIEMKNTGLCVWILMPARAWTILESFFLAGQSSPWMCQRQPPATSLQINFNCSWGASMDYLTACRRCTDGVMSDSCFYAYQPCKAIVLWNDTFLPVIGDGNVTAPGYYQSNSSKPGMLWPLPNYRVLFAPANLIDYSFSKSGRTRTGTTMLPLPGF